jgi:hypothetical protein
MARSFLPQGLSNTCPQTGVMPTVVAPRGQVSNKPKRKRALAEETDCEEAGQSRRSIEPP